MGVEENKTGLTVMKGNRNVVFCGKYNQKRAQSRPQGRITTYAHQVLCLDSSILA